MNTNNTIQEMDAQQNQAQRPVELCDRNIEAVVNAALQSRRRFINAGRRYEASTEASSTDLN